MSAADRILGTLVRKGGGKLIDTAVTRLLPDKPDPKVRGGNLLRYGVGMRGLQVAQVHNGFRSALGRDEALAPIGRLPDTRHGQHFTRQGIVLHQGPVGMQVFGIGQQALPPVGDGAFHRIKRAAVTGQHRVFQNAMQRLL